VVEAARRERLGWEPDMKTFVEVAGLTVQSPVTASTNLLLTVQCVLYFRRLRDGVFGRTGYWALFFGAMAVTTLAGVPKHGFEHLLSEQLYSAMLWISCLGSGAAVYFAQRAALVSADGARMDWWAPGPEGEIDWLGWLPALQAAAYLGAATLWGPDTLLMAGNSAIGLIPVMFAEVLGMRRGATARAWTLAGLTVSLLTGVVYVRHMSVSAWFNYIDLAHVLMGVSFWMMVKGAAGAPAVAAGEVRSHVPERGVIDGFAADFGGRA
jgi:hypothetical protein